MLIFTPWISRQVQFIFGAQERLPVVGSPTLPTVNQWYRKEWGFFSTYYTYITVFIRNAANLTLLLLKGSKLRKGNKN
jgi:ABC-type Fe3+ transport system substrate-binding protein